MGIYIAQLITLILSIVIYFYSYTYAHISVFITLSIYLCLRIQFYKSWTLVLVGLYFSWGVCGLDQLIGFSKEVITIIYSMMSLVFLNYFKNIFWNTNLVSHNILRINSKAFSTKTLYGYILLYHDFLKYVFKKYVYTINHKRIAINYLVFTMWSALAGATLATMIRWELAYPGSHFFKGDSLRYLQVITSHGLTMIFFVVVPVVFGFFANFFIPYHIGSKDVAFPRLNSLGFWLLPGGYILAAKPAFIRSSFFKYFDKPSFFYQVVDKTHFDLISTEVTLNSISLKVGGTLNWDARKKVSFENYTYYSYIPLKFTKSLINPTTAESYWRFALGALKERRKKLHATKCSNSILTMSGWTFITPFSAKTKYTGLGAQDIGIITVLLSGISTTISFTNLLITRRTLSMPGLRNRRVLVPFLSITLFLVMRMLAMITPVLGAAMIMLLMDRHWGTSFFDYAYGGDVVLFQHLFWFFGHPEVYVVIIPAFGIVNMLLPYYNTRRIASKHHLIWATYIMAYMGFLVWGHHMYLVGLDHRSRSMYSTITVMISLPAIVKLVNWTLTMLNGALKVDVALLFVNSFFFFFLCGGLTGMWLSHVGLNIYVHDTFYVVAHFHFMFSAATFSAVYAAIYYYFNIIFGISFSKVFAYLHLIYWTFGQWLTFLPLFWVGYNGLPRRYHDYPLVYLGWHGLSSIGHLLTIISGVFFFLMLIDSAVESKVSINSTFGIPRFNKRVLFYIYKIQVHQ